MNVWLVEAGVIRILDQYDEERFLRFKRQSMKPARAAPVTTAIVMTRSHPCRRLQSKANTSPRNATTQSVNALSQREGRGGPATTFSLLGRRNPRTKRHVQIPRNIRRRPPCRRRTRGNVFSIPNTSPRRIKNVQFQGRSPRTKRTQAEGLSSFGAPSALGSPDLCWGCVRLRSSLRKKENPLHSDEKQYMKNAHSSPTTAA